MTREEIIQQLLVESLHQIVEKGRTSWLLRMLEDGFAGYAHLDKDELEAAAQRLGISLHGAREAESESDFADDVDPADFATGHFRFHEQSLAFDTD